VETYQRKPNCKCHVCDKEIYRRPKQLQSGQVFCSIECSSSNQSKPTPCVICGLPVLAGKHKKTCSRACANKNRTGLKYNKSGQPKFTNVSQSRLYTLKKQFDFCSCMVQGCDYNKTYDIHRHTPGRNGGKYVIGNMFAICPNHHAEVSRGLIQLEKVNDFELKVV